MIGGMRTPVAVRTVGPSPGRDPATNNPLPGPVTVTATTALLLPQSADQTSSVTEVGKWRCYLPVGTVINASSSVDDLDSLRRYTVNGPPALMRSPYGRRVGYQQCDLRYASDLQPPP